MEGMTTREGLLGLLLGWGWDEPTASIVHSGSVETSNLTYFEASLASNIAGVEAVSYRWDFGDGSAFVGPFANNVAAHTYEDCGAYTVHVSPVLITFLAATGSRQVKQAGMVGSQPQAALASLAGERAPAQAPGTASDGEVELRIVPGQGQCPLVGYQGWLQQPFLFVHVAQPAMGCRHVRCPSHSVAIRQLRPGPVSARQLHVAQVAECRRVGLVQ